MVGCGVNCLRHLREVRKEVAVLPTPDALAEHSGRGDQGEQFRRQQDVIDLFRLRAVAECPRAAITLKVRMIKYVAQVRTLGEQRCQWGGIRRVVKVADHGDASYALLSPRVIDGADP